MRQLPPRCCHTISQRAASSPARTTRPSAPDTTRGEFSAGLNSDNWQITAYVENFTDEDDIQSGLGNVNFGFMPLGQVPPFSANLLLPQPRTFGMRARYSF